MKELIQDKVTFGFWVYLMSDCVLFAGLFATYAVLNTSTFGGPSIYEITNLPYVFIETMLLLASSFTVGLAVYFASYAASSDSNQRSRPLGQALLVFVALAATLLLGLAFVGMEVNEFAKLIGEGSGPSRSAFLSSFFALVGTHGTHVFFGSIWMIVLMAHVALKGITEGTMRKLICFSLFWHFLDVIWIFIFTLVYLLGAIAI